MADVELRTTDDNITFLGGVTLDGASLITPTTMSTDANWTTPFTGIPLAANAAATTGGGNIVFNSTLRSNPSGDTAAAYRGNDLTLETGTGNIQFIGQVGGAAAPAAGRLGVVEIIINAHDVTASTGFSANAIYQQAGDGETAFNGFVQTNGRRDVLTPAAATNFGVDITTNDHVECRDADDLGTGIRRNTAAIRLNNSGTMSIVAGAGSINSDGVVLSRSGPATIWWVAILSRRTTTSRLPAIPICRVHRSRLIRRMPMSVLRPIRSIIKQSLFAIRISWTWGR